MAALRLLSLAAKALEPLNYRDDARKQGLLALASRIGHAIEV
jgi:hypothetical protein